MEEAEPAGVRPMRILEVETFGRGGLAHYSYNLSCALADRGHQVTLLTASAYELEGRPLSEGMRVVAPISRLSNSRSPSLPTRARSLLRRAEVPYDAAALAARVRRMRPDVVHLHSTNVSSLLYLMLLRTTGVPIVTTAHQVTPHEPAVMQQTIYRGIHRIPDLVVAHSNLDRGRLTAEFGVDGKRIVVIPHGEYGFFRSAGPPPRRDEARRALGLGPQHEVVVFFGHIREYKGLDILFEAWPTVVATRPNARLVVAGDASRLSDARRDELLAWADRVGAIHRFEYIPLADVAGFFAAADAVAMPYRQLSQSGVLYLALALDVPVVATTVGALPEVLRDGEDALLIPPESPTALGRALIRMLGDPGLRARLARGGRRIAERHSWPVVAEATERVFSRLV